jgi:acyl transferase domain-containing protein/acetylornithine/succinyldiaminopimelate/putrescine aminotransferase
VLVTHRGVNRLVRGVDYMHYDASQRILQVASLAFDASTFEIWGALLNGGRVVIHPEPVPTPQGLNQVIHEHGITAMLLTTALFNTIVDEDARCLSGLRTLLVGGEAASVPHIRRALDVLPDTTLVNAYGPTEGATITTAYAIPRDFDGTQTSVPIGAPIRDTYVRVLDADLRETRDGDVGELFIGGAGLARGYLGRPDLTAERFIEDPFAPGQRLYRSGDRVRWLPSGVLDYVGRTDAQVKIRGFRVEPGEIETILARHDQVAAAAVVARPTPGDAGKRLVAYFVAKAGAHPSPLELRSYLASTLPEYMVPSAFVRLPSLPLTSNGKLDQRALPDPESRRPDLGTPYLAPRNAREETICRVFADLLALDRVGARDNFFELGGSSLLALKAALRLRDEGLNLQAVKLFQFPTAEGLVRFLDREGTAPRPVRAAPVARPSATAEAVAIVGMAGRFPGARTITALWNNLVAGVDSVRTFGPHELDPSLDPAVTQNPSYVRTRGVLDDVDAFDPAFFGITPREAQIMDPQQRLFLETAWETLENAGHVPESFAGRIGVFGGMYTATYFQHHVSARPDLIARLGALPALVANEKDFIATRIAHKLNLTGPALSIHTACSTSLVAIAVAFDSLRNHHCDIALAGGVSVTCPPASGYLYQEGAMLSRDGKTRAFDQQATGTVFSDGVAMVALRRLSDAQRDGDTIYAVLVGAAINNDGADKASFTAPSVEGQAAVISAALEISGVDARTISYVEAHGTATPLGDPIEVEALTQAYRRYTADRGFCGLGSIKSNFGHTVTVAGVAGLIKTALALRQRRIPATLHFEAPNPKLDLEASPFFVLSRETPWEGPSPRRAGVSSFGVGGTNAHVILEEAPEEKPSGPARSHELLPLSARTPGQLDAATSRLADHLNQSDDALPDVAYTLQQGRRAFAHRRIIVARDRVDAAKALRDPGRQRSAQVPERSQQVAFLFPGQGAQYVGMGREMYAQAPIFRDAFDACAEEVSPTLGRDLRALVFADESSAEAAETLRATSITQPALFSIEYSLARFWMSAGVEPSAMIGHSVGELVAATLAGVFSLHDALRLVAHRGRLMQAQPAGSMLSVRLGASDVESRLFGDLAIASDNSPGLCVLAGPTEEIAAIQRTLEADGVVCRALHTSHAFHSPMMDDVLGPFAEIAKGITLSKPKIPFVSTATGAWIRDDEATDPSYWVHHLRRTVRFREGIALLLAAPETQLLEVGPRQTLTTLARQQGSGAARIETALAGADGKKPRVQALATLGDAPADEWPTCLAAAGSLWLAGVPITWEALHVGTHRRRVALPTYPFERQRFWIDATPHAAASAPAISEPRLPPLESSHATWATAPCEDPSHPPPNLDPAVFLEVDRTMAESATAAEPRADGSRRAKILVELARHFDEVSGVEIAEGDRDVAFVELGLDSLTLTQVAQQLQQTFGVKVTFRQLMAAQSTLSTLCDYLEEQMPKDAFAPEPAAAMAPEEAPAPRVAALPLPAPPPAQPLAAPSSAPAGTVQYVIDQQLAIMREQLRVLSGGPAPVAAPVAALAPSARPAPPPAKPPSPPASGPAAAKAPAPAAKPAPAAEGNEPDPTTSMQKYDVKKAFGAIARIHLATAEELTPHQRARLEAFIRRYTTRTRASKEHTQKFRHIHADPRAVTGFRPTMKELVYPIHVARSKGPHLWDIDGNQYVDVLNGFGCNYFGWQPDFVSEAVKRQIDTGIEIGPQTPLAEEVAALFSDLTGAERVAFCNTGSEAVMGCMRVARTVTGRSTIAIFTGSYHGIFDEVIVRGTKKLRAHPAAPGILPATSQNVLVLDYGTPESLEILRARAEELAAILVEPVQSRRPDFQPRDYLVELRKLTERCGAVYIFDEVITGFRTAPGGAQEHFGIQADIASYGKVVGGGYPIGIIAGKRQFMDALDGGHWQFGDDSAPTVGVTYFAGTFVRHPLSLAACKAVLLQLKEKGPALQREMNERTQALANAINTELRSLGAPLEIRSFSTLWKPFWTEEQSMGDLLFFMMRDRGVHIYDGFPCFMTTSHGPQEVEHIVRAFRESVIEMQEGGFLPGARRDGGANAYDAARPPVPGARLGRDETGAPAWFVPNPEQPGKYMKVAQ